MHQISRFHATGKKQLLILSQLDRYIANCPLNEYITLERAEYDQLRLLMPNLLRGRKDVQMGYGGRLLKCRGVME